MAEKTAETTVEQTSKELAEPETRRALIAFWSNPEMQAAIRSAAASMTDGTLDALTEPERAQRIAALTDAMAGSFAASFSRRMTPHVVAMAGNAMDAAIARALSADNRAAAREMMTEMTQAGAQAMAVAIRDEIGPALRQSISQEVGPALTAMLDPKLNHALATTSRQVAYASMLGVQHSLIGDTVSDEAVATGAGIAGQALLFLKLLVAMTVLGLLGLVGLIVWLRVQTRREEARMRRREAGTLFLVHALQASEDKPWSPELRDLVRETLEDLSQRPRHAH